MKKIRIDRRQIIAVLCTVLAGPISAQVTARVPAPAWLPSKPITLVVSVAPGSSVDMVARLLAEKLPPVLGQPVVVVNRPGAGGLIAAQFVARSEPDGHTLLVGSNTMLGAPHTIPKVGANSVDVLRDLAPIIIPATSPMVVMANPALGVKNAKQLVAHLKKNPGLPYATAGQGSPFHFAGEMFSSASGTQMSHVPYRGVMPAVVDTIAGQVMLTFGALGGVGQFIDAGKLVPVAVGEKQRTRLLPDVPTLRESGIPIDFTLFFPVFAPSKTPDAIINRMNREIGTAMQLADVRERLLVAGVEARFSTVEQARVMVDDQYRSFEKLAAEFNIRE